MGGGDSFDDAYLSGEIVSILMKHEKYDDERLVEHMVKWGQIMGIGKKTSVYLLYYRGKCLV